jgi:hypothetical protein
MILDNSGYLEKSFNFLVLNIHHYYPENDIFEDRILKALDWQIFPLDEESDLY